MLSVPVVRRQGTLVAVGMLIAYLLAFVLVLIAVHGPTRVTVVDLMQVLPPLIVCVFCGFAARRAGHPRIRLFWLLIATAHLCSALGNAAWAYYEVVLKTAVPYPSIADIGWIAFYVLAFVGLLGLVSLRDKNKSSLCRLILDAMLFAVSAGALCWELIIAPAYDSSAGLLVTYTNVSYVAGDMLLLVGLGSLLLSNGRAQRPRGLAWLCASFAIWFVADTTFAVLTSRGGSAGGAWLDLLWPLGYVIAGVSALVFLGSSARAKADAQTAGHSPRAKMAAELVRMIIPYVAIPSIAALLCFEFILNDGDLAWSVTALGLALLLTGMVLLRQWFVVIEHRRLQASLTELSQGLEIRVAERTGELVTEKRRLAMLNHVADEMSQCVTARDVVRSGLRLACRTAGCAQSALWLSKPGGRAQFLGEGGLSRAGRLQLLSLAGDPEMAEKAQSEGSAVWVADATGAACSDGERATELFTDVVLLPLVSRRAALGLLCLGFRDPAGHPSPDRIELAHGVASQIAVALENARRYDDALRLAELDLVTGLLNSRGLARSLDQELARSRRAGTPFSVVMIDLDDFKLFNDIHGHAAGDQVLRQVAGVLKKALRRSDVVGRQGGDDFMAILPDTTTANAVDCIAHVREALETVGFSPDGECPIPLCVSCGVSTFPYDGRRMGELLAVADANIYRSKQRGGDCVTPAVGRERDEEQPAGLFTVLEGLVVAVDNKDHYTRQHSDEVTQYALEFSDRIGLSLETARPLWMAGLLHDVGKIGIPDHILRKPGRLSEQEFETIKQHVSLGELMIKEIPDLNEVLAAVGSHHERWDGSGYPRGLVGESIPLLGRILAVTDAYSAMTTSRPYRKALGSAAARAELRQVAGSQLDPYLAEAFLDFLDEREPAQGFKETVSAVNSVSSSAA